MNDVSTRMVVIRTLPDNLRVISGRKSDHLAIVYIGWAGNHFADALGVRFRQTSSAGHRSITLRLGVWRKFVPGGRPHLRTRHNVEYPHRMTCFQATKDDDRTEMGREVYHKFRSC